MAAEEPASEGTSDDPLADIRRPPQSYAENCPAYWKSFANIMVRTQCSFVAEPATKGHLAQAVQASTLSTVKGEEGRSCVLILMDVDLLGDHGQAATLGRATRVDASVVAKLVHGALLGRGAQRNHADKSEVTVPIDQDAVVIFEAPGRDVKHTVASTFKAAANKGTALDCEQKISTVVFHEEEEAHPRR